MAIIPESHIDLLQGKLFGHLATVSAEGAPQVTPVWFRFVDGHLEVNSAKGRLKDRNMRANPQVAMSLIDPENSYRYLELRGRVVEITEEGADQMIDDLAHHYMGVEKYPYRQPGEQRVKYVIHITRCSSMG